jgi:uncharacterized protein (TIGR03067 family)
LANTGKIVQHQRYRPCRSPFLFADGRNILESVSIYLAGFWEFRYKRYRDSRFLFRRVPMKRGCILLTVLTGVLIGADFAGHPATAADRQQQPSATSAAHTDWSAWNGTWRPDKAVFAGQPVPEEQLQMMTLKMNQGTFEFSLPGFVEKGRLAVTPAAPGGQSPGQLDVIVEEGPENGNKGQTIPAIYRFESGRLVICYGTANRPRPTEFRSDADNQQAVIEYRKRIP